MAIDPPLWPTNCSPGVVLTSPGLWCYNAYVSQNIVVQSGKTITVERGKSLRHKPNFKETMMAKEVKEPDFLDEVKAIERAVRAQALAKMLSTLKDKAHEVLELKEYIQVVLDELGVETGDAKRLIDWINSLDSVKLTESDKQGIRDDARDDVHSKRKDAEKKITEDPKSFGFIGYSNTGSLPGAYGTVVTTLASNATGSTDLVIPAGRGNVNHAVFNHATLSAGGSSLDVKLR